MVNAFHEIVCFEIDAGHERVWVRVRRMSREGLG